MPAATLRERNLKRPNRENDVMRYRTKCRKVSNTYREKLAMRIVGAVCVCLLMAAATVQAQVVAVPDTMNYQATLIDAAGNVVSTGSYSLEMRIYDTKDSSTPLNTLIWGPQQFNGGTGTGQAPLVSAIDGMFSIILGPVDVNGDALSDAFLEANRWLEITVIDFPSGGSDTIFTPRQRILSAPYAMRAKDAETLGNQTLKVVSGKVAIGGEPVTDVDNVMLTIAHADSPRLRIKSLDGAQNGNLALVEFYAGDVRKGFMGLPNAGNDDVSLASDNGKLILKSLGNLEWNAGEFKTAKFGEWVMGDVGHGPAFPGIANSLHANAGGYALLQGDNGETDVNAPAGSFVALRINNANKLTARDSEVRIFTDARVDRNLRVYGTGSGGDVFIGHVGHNTWAGFANNARANINDYALIHNDGGHTILNVRDETDG